MDKPRVAFPSRLGSQFCDVGEESQAIRREIRDDSRGLQPVPPREPAVGSLYHFAHNLGLSKLQPDLHLPFFTLTEV